MVRWCWVNFLCRGVHLISTRVGQGPIALAVGAGGGCLGIFFSHVSFLFSVSLFLGDGPILTEILSQRAVKPKPPTNQSMHRLGCKSLVRLCEAVGSFVILCVCARVYMPVCVCALHVAKDSPVAFIPIYQ